MPQASRRLRIECYSVFPSRKHFRKRTSNKVRLRVAHRNLINLYAISPLSIRSGGSTRIKAGQVDASTFFVGRLRRLKSSRILPRLLRHDPSSNSPILRRSPLVRADFATNARALASGSIPTQMHKEIPKEQMSAVRIQSDDLSTRPRGHSRSCPC